jgi:putative DNA primase/helicase
LINSFQCPKILKFMHEVMADDDVETVLDFIAYCLWRGFPFHKLLLFVGFGRNGKGVMTEIIRRLLGTRNVSGESLQQILTNRFASARLFGKLANIDADLSKETLRNTGILKKLTGGDLIRAEEKYKTPFDFINYAKLIFAANQLPDTEDHTSPFFSRPIIIKFPNQFVGEKADHHIIDKLCTEEELTRFLSLVIERLPRVLKDGIRVKNKSIEETYENYISASDSFRAFVEAVVEQNEGNKIQKNKVYQEYVFFCRKRIVTPEFEQSFSRKMTNYGFRSKQFLDNTRGGRLYYWIDIALKEIDRDKIVTTKS